MSARPAASPKLVVLELSVSALRVLAARYIRRDPTGQVAEAAAELFLRVARAVAHAELILGPGREADR
jgi:ribonucleotide reductase alpha subunit